MVALVTLGGNSPLAPRKHQTSIQPMRCFCLRIPSAQLSCKTMKTMASQIFIGSWQHTVEQKWQIHTECVFSASKTHVPIIY